MVKLSTQPYKGSRDFYPEQMRLQRYIFDTWRRVAELYGYEEVGGPLLELTDLYRAKSGEEIINEQTYSFQDRGGRDVTIRPEMTPTLARMVAARQQELAFPARWYSIVNNWRYERPQYGRLREHWQLNVDVFGSDSIDMEDELISLGSSIMKAFKADQSMYKIRINSRKLISLLLGEYLKLDVESAHRLTKLLDRKAKMSEAAFKMQAEELVGDSLERLMDLLNVKRFDELPAQVVESGLVEDLRQLFERLEAKGIKNVEFDPTLMRGFDYYTGIVFEFYDVHPENNRSLFGGGRYDDLVTIFGAPRVPAVGFGMGDVTIANFLQLHDLLPPDHAVTQVYVITLDESVNDTARQLAQKLRSKGVRTTLDTTERKAAMKIRTADRQRIPHAIFIGSEEAQSGTYTLKDLASGKEERLTLEQILDKLA